MIHNAANCEIYIGKNAGNKLLSDIRAAQKTIKIVSPFLSPSLITELILIHRKKVDIQLITADTIEDYTHVDQKNITQLIVQDIATDFDAVKKREKWQYQSKLNMWIGIVLMPIILAVFYFNQDYSLLYGLVPVILLFFYSLYLKIKIRSQRIYQYSYSQLFPFKVYMTPYQTSLSDTMIHSKIFLIDDHIAYLGSLDFTDSGMNHNHETRVRTTDFEAVREIKREFDQLMHHSKLPEKDIQNWGRQLYTEPIN